MGSIGQGCGVGRGTHPCTQDANSGHRLCTDLTPLSLHFRNIISRTVALNILGHEFLLKI